jgi:hypothetical protein
LYAFKLGFINFIDTKAFVCLSYKIELHKYLAVILCLAADPTRTGAYEFSFLSSLPLLPQPPRQCLALSMLFLYVLLCYFLSWGDNHNVDSNSMQWLLVLVAWSRQDFSALYSQHYSTNSSAVFKLIKNHI